MKLHYSTTGKPVVSFDSFFHIVFSTINNDKTIKYLMFSEMYIPMNGNGVEERSEARMGNFLTTMLFKSTSEDQKLSPERGFWNKHHCKSGEVGFFLEMVGKYLNDKNEFPVDKFKNLEYDIEEFNKVREDKLTVVKEKKRRTYKVNNVPDSVKPVEKEEEEYVPEIPQEEKKTRKRREPRKPKKKKGKGKK